MITSVFKVSISTSISLTTEDCAAEVAEPGIAVGRSPLSITGAFPAIRFSIEVRMLSISSRLGASKA
jgi:hypothetical protein